MITLNLKSIASGFAALAVTVVLSWTFVDNMSFAHVKRDANAGSKAVVSVLVR